MLQVQSQDKGLRLGPHGQRDMTVLNSKPVLEAAGWGTQEIGGLLPPDMGQLSGDSFHAQTLPPWPRYADDMQRPSRSWKPELGSLKRLWRVGLPTPLAQHLGEQNSIQTGG